MDGQKIYTSTYTEGTYTFENETLIINRKTWGNLTFISVYWKASSSNDITLTLEDIGLSQYLGTVQEGIKNQLSWGQVVYGEVYYSTTQILAFNRQNSGQPCSGELIIFAN